MATASVDRSGNIVPGTIQVFFENPDGSLVPEAQALADIPSNGTVEGRFASIAGSMAMSPDTTGCTSGPCPVNQYNPGNATYYADNHVWPQCGTGSSRQPDCTSNPAFNGCIEWPSVGSSTYYNPLYWFSPTCDDCANFVSQSINAGGIQLTSAWYEYASTQRVEGSTDWVNAPSLVQYMTSNIPPNGVGTPYWSAYPSQSYVVPGDVLYHYTGVGTGHVMIAVYGDGLSAYWDEHTNDGYHLTISNYEATFYHVTDWVYVP